MFGVKVQNVVRDLILTPNVQAHVRAVFESEMELGLARNPSKPSSLQMENTFLPELCDGSGKHIINWFPRQSFDSIHLSKINQLLFFFSYYSVREW